jgi:hypothetical protein
MGIGGGGVMVSSCSTAKVITWSDRGRTAAIDPFLPFKFVPMKGRNAHTAVIRDCVAQAERKTLHVLFELFIKTALILKSLFVE